MHLRRHCFGAAALAASLAAAWPCRAQDMERDLPRGRFAEDSFEMLVTGAFIQGVGEVHDNEGDTIPSTGPGASAGLALGYRVTPSVSVALGGAFEGYQQLEPWTNGDDAAFLPAMSVGADFQVQLPDEVAAPWMRAGVGYRWLWVPDDDLEHGPQFLRLAGGVDLVAADGFALGPWLGTDLTMLTWWEGSEIAGGPSVFFQGGVRVLLNFEGMAGASPALDVASD
jgi:hypothetical protein